MGTIIPTDFHIFQRGLILVWWFPASQKDEGEFGPKNVRENRRPASSRPGTEGGVGSPQPWMVKMIKSQNGWENHRDS